MKTTHLRLFAVLALLALLSPAAPISASEALPSTGPASSQVALGQSGLSFRYLHTFGVTEQPYLADAQHLFNPNGLFIDGSDHVYVVESNGARLMVYNSSGVNLLSIGVAGVQNRGEYSFDEPKDVAQDGAGNIWVVDRHRVAQYDQAGNFLQEFPPDDPWVNGSDNAHFDLPRGVAFDSAGRMYVSDSTNQRIQIFEFSGGSPVYTATLGVTGEAGDDNAHFNGPFHITIDSNDNLYVADARNHRVQIFDSNHSYLATLGTSGVSGSDNSHFNFPTGVHVSADRIYVADEENHRVQVFDRTTRNYLATIGSGWGPGNGQFKMPVDVSTDSAGNLLVSDYDNHRIQKFDSNGAFVSVFAGTTGVPYVSDNYHYYHPRVALGPDGGIHILEEGGQRLIKLNASGVYQWSVGTPGVPGSDNAHFSWPHGVAVDANGKVYVADGNYRVQIFNPDGTFFATLGTGGGTGDYQFNWASGVAVDAAGNIYVSDGANHRVQIYNSGRVFQATLGITGECGADNSHLCWPTGVETDTAGNIYVVDSSNCRVQKFNASHAYQLTFGLPGDCSDSFDGLSPEDVTVDEQGRVYVANWDNRVQVFNPTAAYLTTIGGDWGASNSLFRGVGGVAVDKAGNVYAADFNNGRLQEYARGVPGWRQANLNGFGERSATSVSALEVFKDQLFAGTLDWNNGGRVWRSADGANWNPAGLNLTVAEPNVIDLFVFNGQLYGGTGWGTGPGQIWRTADGTTWNPIIEDGFGDPTNAAISAFTEFNGSLYAGTGNFTHGAQIWRSPSGDSLSWTNVVTAGLGSVNNYQVTGLKVFNNDLYVAVEQGSNSTPLQVWRTTNGTDWTAVVSDGFGEAANISSSGLAVFNGQLYLGTRNDTTSAQLWRSDNGTSWSKVVGDGFGDPDNFKIESLFVFSGDLYAATQTHSNGTQVWRSADGLNWRQVNPSGFGDSNNFTTLWSNATTVFEDNLYIGTWNTANGGEVWRLLRQVFQPLIRS